MRPVDRLSLKGCLRILVTIVTLGVIMLPFILVSNIENLLLVFLAKKALPAAFIGLYIFGFLRKVLVFFGLEYQENKEPAPHQQQHQYLEKLL